ncbi:hypothetical protein Ahy_B09g094760 isoform F [Arachis hypogaea]|uniref:EGF-like domain-containing protein n=1 Tax=Arachis hypogaea TaxID=3818 RepID=A0A444XC51_ARAHY|nr:hypothetical protein Ahy_B09g094760 isoform F [Arachis hypogaea]
MYTKGENRRKKEERSILQVEQKACNCCNLNKKVVALVFSVAPFYLFLLTLFTCNHSSTSEDECKTAFCGMGTCHETWAGFECDCKHGWSKIQLGPFSSPCVIPNCTFDSQCHVPLPFLPPAPAPPPPDECAIRANCSDGIDLGFGSDPPPSPPPQQSGSPRSSGDIDICQVIFCGVGTCHQTREFPGYRCDCKRGWSKITLPTISSACIVPNCAMKGNCSDGVDLGFGDPPPSPPPQQSASPPPPTSGGSGEMLNNSRELLQKLVATMVLTTIFLI